MVAHDPATLGIMTRTPKRRLGRVVAGIVLLLVAGAAVAVALVLGGLWYAENQAREKLQAYAERAGLELHLTDIVITPSLPIDLIGVELRDPDDGRVLFSAKSIRTDLTLEQVWNGRRRPTRVVVDSPVIDGTDPDRWKRAAARFMEGRKPASTGARREMPELFVVGGRAEIRVPKLDTPVVLTEISGSLVRELEGPWRGAMDATMALGEADRQRIRIDALAGGGVVPEVGVSFEPAFELAMGGRKISVAGAWLRWGEGLRLRTVSASARGVEMWAEQIDISAAIGDAGWGSGPVTVDIRKVRATADGKALEAEAVHAELAPGALRDPAGRLRSVEVIGLDVRSKAHHAALRAARVRIETAGVDPARPLAGLSEMIVDEADIAVAVSAPSAGSSVPLYKELRALLRTKEAGTDENPKGGGPGTEKPPRAGLPGSLATRLLQGARPVVRLNDSSLAITLGSQEKPAIVVEELSAWLQPGDDARSWTAGARGKLHDLASGEDGVFEVAATTDEGGALKRARIKLSGSKLAHQLAALSDSIRLTKSSYVHLDLVVAPHAMGRGLVASGTVGIEMGFFAPRIHGTPVDNVRIEADVNIDFDPDAQKLVLDVPRLLIMDKAVLRLAATIERLDGRLPKLNVQLRMPRQSCNDLLKSIPAVMVPRLKGLELEGSASGFFTFEVDLENPRSYDHDVDVDMRACKAVRYGEADVPRLNRKFVRQVREKGREIGVEVGPGTPHYKSLGQIPRHIRMGALWTEDQRFYRHSGFVPGLIERAVVMNLEGGRYRYGGSSITQQLVKNLFLSREKTLTRKLEEAILVWLVERNVTKNRILELYLNCIEYGPQIYGIGRASRAYFGKHVEQLSPLEGAFLMGLKPYPWAGWQQFERGYVKAWWHKRLGKILTGMAKRGWITEMELEASRPFDPMFLTSAHRPPDPPDPEPWAPPPTPNAPEWID